MTRDIIKSIQEVIKFHLSISQFLPHKTAANQRQLEKIRELNDANETKRKKKETKTKNRTESKQQKTKQLNETDQININIMKWHKR